MPRKTPDDPDTQDMLASGFNEAAARCRGKRQTARPKSPKRVCFNEAAARCRGKQPEPPRARLPDTYCFNEAAARCRGKRGRSRVDPRGRTSFNEAAARCRGKRRTSYSTAWAGSQASMRPRPDAAENAVRLRITVPAAALQ